MFQIENQRDKGPSKKITKLENKGNQKHLDVHIYQFFKGIWFHR